MSVLPPLVAAWVAKYGLNVATAVGAAAYVLYKRSRENGRYPWGSGHTGLQFFTGLAVVPLVLMAGAAFSDTLAQLAMSSNGIIFAGAAAVALGVLLQDREM